MPMGIDNDYDGTLNADDPTPDGQGNEKVAALMQALAALLAPDNAAPAGGVLPSAPAPGTNELQSLLEKLAGSRQPPIDQAGIAPAAPPVDAMPELAAGTPENDESAEDAPDDSEDGEDSAPFKPKAKDESAAESKPNKAKESMSKLAKARSGK